MVLYELGYVLDLAFENIIKVAAISHPSLLKVPEDLEEYLATEQAALLINSCTVNQQLKLMRSPEAASSPQDTKWNTLKGAHGFAVRGDMPDAKVKALSNILRSGS